jgi:hypothetical protein
MATKKRICSRLTLEPIITLPDEDPLLAKTSSRALAHHLHAKSQTHVIRLVADGQAETMTLPGAAFRLLLNLLGHMVRDTASR